MRRIHANPIDAHDRGAGWATFIARMEMSHHSAVRSITRRGLPTSRPMSQLDDWLPAADEMLGDADDAVIVHGALRYQHINVEHVDGSYVPRGTANLGTYAPCRPPDIRSGQPVVAAAFRASRYRRTYPGERGTARLRQRVSAHSAGVSHYPALGQDLNGAWYRGHLDAR